MLSMMKCEARSGLAGAVGRCLLTGYDLVSSSLANRKLSHVPPAGAAADAFGDPRLADLSGGSAHAALRQALQQPFVGKGIAGFASRRG